jgi:hypothetical protein
METQLTDIPPEPGTPFELRWRGYDRDQVDTCIRDLVSEQQRLQSRLATIEASHAIRHQEQADDVVALARRHAEEIRAAAEQEAHRLLRDAETRAAQLQADRLQTQQRHSETMASLHRDIEWCLTTITAALTHVRELSAPQGGTAPAAPDGTMPSAEAATPPSRPTEALLPPAGPATAALAPADAEPAQRRRVRGAAALWTVLMCSIVLMLMLRPIWPQGAPAPSTPATPEPSTTAPVEPVSARPSAAAEPETTTLAAAQEPAALTVRFVALRDCWISVDVDGGGPRERLLRSSESYVVQAREALVLKAGNAAALSLVINEQPTPPLGREGQVVTRRITRANYRSLLEGAPATRAST